MTDLYNTTIMKQNPLIHAVAIFLDKAKSHDLFNAVIHQLQNQIKEYHGQDITLFNYKEFSVGTIVLEAEKIRGYSGINKDTSNKEIANIIASFGKESITLMNFIDVDGTKIKQAHIFILEYVKIRNDKRDARKEVFEIKFTDTFLKLISKEFSQKVGNYTVIDVKEVCSVNSKHGKVLLEKLQSMKNFKDGKFDMKHQELIQMFDIKQTAFSHVVRTIERNYEKVNATLPFTYETHKKDKIITFKITTNRG